MGVGGCRGAERIKQGRYETFCIHVYKILKNQETFFLKENLQGETITFDLILWEQ